MKVLSLFDGISCGQLALQKAGIEYSKYFASEIEETAIKVTQTNFPKTIQIGDVCKAKYVDGILYTENGNFEVGKIDLLIGGSPCQDLSKSKQGAGLDGEKSKLFFEFVRLLKEVQPTFWLLENVETKFENELSEVLGVVARPINADLFVQQNRPRLYWSNFKIDTLPKRPNWQGDYFLFSRRDKGWRKNANGVCYCLLANMGTGGNNVPYMLKNGEKERLSIPELEALQGLPVGYTSGISKTKALFHIGNGWAVPVISHIFKSLKVCSITEKHHIQPTTLNTTLFG